MTRFLFLLALLLMNSLTALSLKDKVSYGAVGDYIVTEQNQFCSLLRIHTISPPTLIIEEISFPRSSTPKDFEKWLSSGAEGHTSWSLIEIDLTTNNLEKCFSFTKNAWLVPSTEDSFLLKILNTPFQLVQENERRKIGPPPSEGQDTRKIWNPALIFQGKKEPSPQFTAYQFIYPKDGSPLSGKRIELFFNKNKENFPFPYWGQVTDDSEAALKFRVIDSGQNLPSPKKSLL